jgi:glycosyltransferase involved in cell wall biosynthesis
MNRNRAERRRRIVVVSNVDLLYANGGVTYLSDALGREGNDVHLIVPHLEQSIGAIERCRTFTVHSARPDGILGMRRIRWLSFNYIVRRLLRKLSPFDIAIFTNYVFLRNAAYARRVSPSTRLVHYALEFYRPGEDWPMSLVGGEAEYRSMLPLFDLHVDVDKTRSRLREHDYELSSSPLVLPNTVPHRRDGSDKRGCSIEKIAKFNRKPDCPILVYCGSNGRVGGIDVILDALAGIIRPFIFVAFMYEGERSNADVRRVAIEKLGEERVRIEEPVNRDDLAAVISQADCAISYYDQSLGANFKYCAPSKVFEYISAGLPIISSSNPSMVDLIEGGGLGICARDDSAEGIRVAIERLLFDSALLLEIRRRAVSDFEASLCFERASKGVVDAIANLAE